ncbi:respiratory nitrate reductase chaperone NarJ [Actinacidiphila yanglinensis]|uniref:Respiratory nitrate reductase chaperone NarJ n=1 Tax=Actinacidiphila yanglinensis TaxID=310779 RepID=A0A1H6A9Z9_9ACTN|nr:nitrate reductase molybdenum cofactor assembly chaperone [Actinacidiphila yanglinensis]SEG45192.1 respiratory nitrate reductase chaperone NarJ [Actinacidiphila yanglinensis]
MSAFSRGGRAAPPPVTYPTAVLHQAAARLLAYPDAELAGQLPLLRAALVSAGTDPAALLLPVVDHLAGAEPPGPAAEYVRTFDFTSRHCLHLTWWTDGDTRRRGAALLRFKEHYRAHGMEPGDDELPDFLPVVLEFSAATRTDGLLREHRPALELLRLALTESGTPYARVLEAVCATLPGASPADRAQARAMARGGPPSEAVGLMPYGHLDLLPVLTE